MGTPSSSPVEPLIGLAQLGCSAFVAFVMGALAALVWPAMARAETPLQTELQQQVRELALQGSRHANGKISRVDVEVGQLDPRLRLAPCHKVQPYLPPGATMWGRTRVGMRCVQGTTAWNVYLPITVKVFGPGLVAAAPLPAGSVISAADLAIGEVDLAEDASTALVDKDIVIGRTLSRALNAGQGLRQSHLKVRQWFAAGDTVRVIAAGAGFSIAGEGLALTPGTEGHPARVKTENGRIVTGMPVSERAMEVAL